MPIKFHINRPVLNAELERAVEEQSTRRLKRAIQQEARRNFRNRTGNLYRSIRIQDGMVLVGSRRIHYWRFVYNFTRGDGRIWITQGAARVARTVVFSAVRAELSVRRI